VLELALRESVSLGHPEIRPEDILIGLIRENDGVAARILLEHSIDMDTLESLLQIGAERPGRLEDVPPSPMSTNLRIALNGALDALLAAKQIAKRDKDPRRVSMIVYAERLLAELLEAAGKSDE
jgi:hypothetical protein